MTELSVLQRWFQTVISHPDGIRGGVTSSEAQALIELPPGELERVIQRSESLGAGRRLAVYANAYYARLLEVMKEIFPSLVAVVGEEAFLGLAFGYLQLYPPTSYTLDHLGDHFVDYVERTHDPDDDSGLPELLADLAVYELAVAEVFDGEGPEGMALLTPASLGDLDGAALAEARIRPVPGLRLLEHRWRLTPFILAVHRGELEEEPPVTPPDPSRELAAVFRQAWIVRHLVLDELGWRILGALQSGATVGEAIATAAEASEASDDELAAAIEKGFRSWTEVGLFLDFEDA